MFFVSAKLKIILQMSLVLVWGARIPTVRIGRVAGQYGKPRSSPYGRFHRSIDQALAFLFLFFYDAVCFACCVAAHFAVEEVINGKQLCAFKGDNVTGFEPTEVAREHIPTALSRVTLTRLARSTRFAHSSRVDMRYVRVMH